jgi:hypothetical protein
MRLSGGAGLLLAAADLAQARERNGDACHKQRRQHNLDADSQGRAERIGEQTGLESTKWSGADGDRNGAHRLAPSFISSGKQHD